MSREEIVETLISLCAKTYRKNAADLSEATTFAEDLKGPSVLFVGLTSLIESECDVMLSITEAAGAKTIGELADLVYSRQGE